MHLIEVRFKGNRKEFFHWASDAPLAVGAPVIVEADRGEDLGVVHSIGELAAKRFAGVSHGEMAGPVTHQVLRPATEEEYESEHQLRHQDDETARRQSMERVRAHGLTMKVTDAEWQWDRKKLTLYFTAERRVDFRALVRDLAGVFRARIELKQIGVRDEARRLDGIGRCGRQYCSASWLPELRPVNLGVAKDQGLSLNPLQISGACGRLMCCLRYEHEFYVQSRKRFPKEGRILVTARGEEKVVSNDIFNDRVTLRNVEGDVRIAELADLRADIAAWSEGRAGAGRDTDLVTHHADAVDVEEEAEVGGESAAEDDRRPRPDRPPRPRRALPMRESAGRPRSSRPPGRIRSVASEATPTGARPSGDRPQDEQGRTGDGDAPGPTTDTAADSPTPVAVGDGAAPQQPTAAKQAGAGKGQDDVHVADSPVDSEHRAAGEDGDVGVSPEETRRRRRRGRRGGRRGRSSREESSELPADRAAESGAASRRGPDDQGE